MSPKKTSTGDERREYTRFAMTGVLPGTLKNGDGTEFESIPVDVSKNGLGLLLEPGPKLGEILTLEIAGEKPQALTFKVRWFQLDVEARQLRGLDTLCRCGLELNDESLDLVKMLANFHGLQLGE